MQKLKTKISFLLAFAVCGILSAQTIKVTGNVTDVETGMPIPGASIIEQNTNNGVAADFDGNYEITVPSSASLIISSIGFVPQTISLNGQTTINVSLSPDVSQLDEVVVVGFGTQKRENVTGAASYVQMDEIINDRPIVDATQALQGAAAGLQIVQSSGQPGDRSTSINIRGFTSINGGSPLILINNVPGDIEDLNPRDIESISVLKDAAASSIYGARAAFGVVLITTKSAKRNQKVSFSYDVTTSVSRAVDQPEKATTRQFVESLDTFGVNAYFAGQNVDRWIELLDLYDANQLSQLNLVNDPINNTTYPIHFEESSSQFYPLADSDIIDDFIKNFGYSTIHNFAVSGGGEKVGYRLSTGYAFEDGVMVTDKDSFKKYNVNALVDADITPKLTSSSNILFRSSIQSVPNAQYNQALQLRMYDPTGFFDDGSGDVLPFASPGNIVRFSVPTKRDEDNIRLFQRLEWKPFKDFSLTGEYTFEKKYINTVAVNNAQRYYSTFRFNPTVSAEDALRNSSLRKTQTNRIYNGFNIYGKYNLTFGDHNFNFLLGFNKEDEKQDSFSAFRNDLIDPDTPTFNLAQGENFSITDSFYDWAVVGYFGRVNYTFLDRYFIEGNLRYDGSSRFASGSRYAWLPSVSVGWDISEEPFMEGADFISLLKPRASWGKIGNQEYRRPGTNVQEYYPSIPGYESFLSDWINLSTDQRFITFNPAQLVSDTFTWEEVVTKNLGIDANFFKNRLSTSFDIYTRETLGMLKAALPLPAILGTSAPLQNDADLETKGWDLEIGWNDKIGEFSYGINVNVFDSQSEITRFETADKFIGQFYEGHEIGEIWGYVTDGFYTVDDFVEGTLNADLSGSNRELRDGVPFVENSPVPYPGDIKYKDLDGDGLITDGNGTVTPQFDDNGNLIADTGPGDRKRIGNNTRRYQFGINGNAAYKGFDFSFVLSGVGKRDRWRATGADLDVIFPYPSVFDHIYANQLDFWTPDNQDAFYPRIYGDASTGNIDSNYARSRFVQTKYLSDESYLRIQNLTFGYSFNDNLLERLRLNKLRVFVSANNPFIFDNLQRGLDPDQQNDGAGIRTRYPIMAQYSVGLNVSF
ncbi:TonB-dependent receptor [Flagellimonas sp. S3867]|uniref:SusC/RagA family TonB-linked outer membrane protein n=1 Tax=Flagellimonas sp. S3867 TaxID=2768063 RepID=UPI001689B5AD|nr:TonB-dependent receptor [Flagellimonas sp. S3867]